MPIQRRLPKFGFKNPTRVEYKAVNVSDLQKLVDATGINVINLDLLVEAGLASPKNLVKILGNGEITAKVEVSADAFSKSAIAKIEAAGGTTSIAED